MSKSKKYNYNMELLQDNFWIKYLNSNSPSKCFYDKQGANNYHRSLKLWMEFLKNYDKVKLMFWNNDELGITLTHLFSKA